MVTYGSSRALLTAASAPGGPRVAAASIVALLVGLVLLVGALVTAGAAHATATPPAPPSAKESEQRSAVLAAEDRRLVEVRTITSLARWQGKNWKTPYRLGTPAGYTLVLTPRSEPYQVDDLLALAPQTFLRMSDGSYVLSEHIVVTANATLALSAPGGLTLRLASSSSGFATIVSFGGRIELSGEVGAPVELTSWDVDAAAPDDQLDDGRAYLRSVGGQFEANHVHATKLGFWSGRTGGIALTGTDRPNTGAIESGGGAPSTAPGAEALLDDMTWQPAGPITPPSGGLGYSVPSTDYVSSELNHVTVDHSAFGLFVSGAKGVQIADSTFTDNTYDGVLFHRYVTNGVVTRTTSRSNGGDGFALARATTGITISESTASDNAGSGYTLDGRALADGPSAVGASLRPYGNNLISHSTAANNAHDGIVVNGGFNVSLLNNIVEGHDMGITIAGPAERISVTGNSVRASERHGIAAVDGVRDSTITGNVVEGSSTGVYLRDSSAQVKGNTVQDAGTHGVSVLGQGDGAEVSYNVLAGSGASALDTMKADGTVRTFTNNIDGWQDTTPWYLWFKKLLRPMNVLWCLVVVLVVVSALRRRRSKDRIEHPYAEQLAMFERLKVTPPIDLTANR